MIAAHEGMNGELTVTDESTLAHDRGQFIEIQVNHEQAILELVNYRLVTAMPDDSFVDATVHASSSIPK